MKVKTSILIALLIISSGCQPNDKDVIENEILEEQTSAKTIHQADFLYTLEIQTRLQWTAFITAKILLKNRRARIEINQLTNNGTVDLNALLGANFNAPYFRSAFVSELTNYVYNWQTDRAEPDEDTPPGGIVICCPIGPLSAETIITTFMDIMSAEDSFEIYLPKPLLFNTRPGALLKISSTGHPLSMINENAGFLRYSRLQTFEDGFTGYANQVTVDNVHVESHGKIIVTRPIQGGVYDTGVFPVTDFTFFLSGEQ